MSLELIDHSWDLKKLRLEGYELEVKHGFALVHHIPYVNSNKEIKFGTLVSSLSLAGEITTTPSDHVIYFIGEHPHNKDGNILTSITHSSTTQTHCEGITTNHSFSNKPQNGFSNYYDKFTSYINIISAEAEAINDNVSAITNRVIENNDIGPFKYFDTNAAKSGITNLTQKFTNQKIGIIGLGGTGAYVLDLVSKTPVEEIHLFDGDQFLQNNAFRAPGATSIEDLREKYYKVDYYKRIYSNMHVGINAHRVYLGERNDCLINLDFVFLCIDSSENKRLIIEWLIANNKAFIDTGVGINLVDDSLLGTVRITLGTPSFNEHISKRISFGDTGVDDLYTKNIQIAELNSLNATLAVIRWKKMIGFYHDHNVGYNSLLDLSTGALINEDSLDES